jgi:hypothetical protein
MFSSTENLLLPGNQQRQALSHYNYDLIPFNFISMGEAMTTITSIFSTQTEAHNVVSALLHDSFKNEEISVTLSRLKQQRFSCNDNDIKATPPAKQAQKARPRFGATALYSSFGVLLAGLSAVGSVIFPGSGLLVVGPMIVTWAGASVDTTISALLPRNIKSANVIGHFIPWNNYR